MYLSTKGYSNNNSFLQLFYLISKLKININKIEEEIMGILKS